MYQFTNGAPRGQHYVKYLMPTATGNDVETIVPMEERNVQAAIDAALTYRVVGFYFYDIVFVGIRDSETGQKLSLASEPVNISGVHYIDAELYNMQRALRELPGLVVANMQAHKHEHIVRCRTGAYQPFTKGHDVLVSA